MASKKNTDAQTEKTKEEKETIKAERENIIKYGNQLDSLTLLNTNSAQTELYKQDQIKKQIKILDQEIKIARKKGDTWEADRLHELQIKYYQLLSLGIRDIGLGTVGGIKELFERGEEAKFH